MRIDGRGKVTAQRESAVISQHIAHRCEDEDTCLPALAAVEWMEERFRSSAATTERQPQQTAPLHARQRGGSESNIITTIHACLRAGRACTCNKPFEAKV